MILLGRGKLWLPFFATRADFLLQVQRKFPRNNSQSSSVFAFASSQLSNMKSPCLSFIFFILIFVSFSPSSVLESTIYSNTDAPNAITSEKPKNTDHDWTWKDWLIVVAILLGGILIVAIAAICVPKRVPQNYEKFDDSRPSPRGLNNLGNTCYFNSVVQCLVHTPILKTQLQESGGKSGNLTKAYLTFDEDMAKEVSDAMRPHDLLEEFRKNKHQFQPGQQHDSHECLRHFLGLLKQEEKVNWKDKKQLTVVDKIFGGHFITVYVCGECATPFHLCEPFLDISVPIAEADTPESDVEDVTGDIIYQRLESATETSSNKEAIKSMMIALSPRKLEPGKTIQTLEDCLQYFTRQENLKKEYICNVCNKWMLIDENGTGNLSSSQETDLSKVIQTVATKQMLIFNPPAVLTIHMKRFKQEKSMFVKRDTQIQFGDSLDIAPYCSFWCLRNEEADQTLWYSLYAVVVHYGSLKSGHYISYVKVRQKDSNFEKLLQKEYLDRDLTAEDIVEMIEKLKGKDSRKGREQKTPSKEGTWYRLDDSKVSEVSRQEVFAQKAFLLFYERVSQHQSEYSGEYQNLSP